MRSFATTAAFASFLAQKSRGALVAQEAALLKGAKIIRDEARGYLGHYQAGSGPFSEWADLAPSTQAERDRLGFATDDPLYRTGELRAHVLASAAPHGAAVGVPDLIVGSGGRGDPLRNIGKIARWLEFGTSKSGVSLIPPRSFLGRAAFEKGEEAAGEVGYNMGVYLTGMRVNRAPK